MRSNQAWHSLIFKYFIQRNRMINIPVSNGMHTWSNWRIGSPQIASILDHFLILDNAILLGGEIYLSILPSAGFGHWPILLQWSRPRVTNNWPFCFEKFWLSHLDFKDLVTTWGSGFTPLFKSKMYQFQQKLKHLKYSLKKWNHSTFGNIFQHQKDLE